MTSTHEFPNDPGAVRAARQFVLGRLEGYAPDVREVAELLVSELATNAVRHTESGFTVQIDSDRDQIQISVTDGGTGAPEVQDLDPGALSGRGLALVEMLSSSWGVRPGRSAAGKTVWLVLDAPAPDLQADPSAHAGARSVAPFARGQRGPRRRRISDGPEVLRRRGAGADGPSAGKLAPHAREPDERDDQRLGCTRSAAARGS